MPVIAKLAYRAPQPLPALPAQPPSVKPAHRDRDVYVGAFHETSKWHQTVQLGLRQSERVRVEASAGFEGALAAAHQMSLHASTRNNPAGTQVVGVQQAATGEFFITPAGLYWGEREQTSDPSFLPNLDPAATFAKSATSTLSALVGSDSWVDLRATAETPELP